ncbi:hypothetical protein [Nostoc sp.]|uniref:hypothetical protein n=1 Tax=Nostoc sp. TaxID=1180 RepID=UPI002FFA83C4
MKHSVIIHLIPNLEIWRCLPRAIRRRRSYDINSRDNFAMRSLIPVKAWNYHSNSVSQKAFNKSIQLAIAFIAREN